MPKPRDPRGATPKREDASAAAGECVPTPALGMGGCGMSEQGRQGRVEVEGHAAQKVDPSPGRPLRPKKNPVPEAPGIQH